MRRVKRSNSENGEPIRIAASPDFQQAGGARMWRANYNNKVPSADRSLAIFVKALVGLKVVVELNNDAIARGVLDAADSGMQLTLSEASFQPLQGDVQSMDILFLRGTSIRYIHLPSWLKTETRVEARRRQILQERKEYLMSLGPQTRAPKGVDGTLAEGAAEQILTESA